MLGDFFDRKSDYSVNERLRPHWSQAGAIVFVTFRCKDSIPRTVLKRWELEKNQWLDQRNLRHGRFWKEVVAALDQDTADQFRKHFNRCREDCLDQCHGKCLLSTPEIAKIIADSLLHFDGDRYQMGDFVVMPNHVHLLCAFPTEEAMERQFESWLHFTATKINQATAKRGHFWQQEPFDHLVRSPEQYDYLRWYIQTNPEKARLSPNQYLYHRLKDEPM